MNQCPKLYFLNQDLPIILYTDASDYAHGAYLCQVQTQTDGSLLEQPIRFLSGTFAGAQTRWSTIEKEAYAIYWALKSWMIYSVAYASRYEPIIETYYT